MNFEPDLPSVIKPGDPHNMLYDLHDSTGGVDATATIEVQNVLRARARATCQGGCDYVTGSPEGREHGMVGMMGATVTATVTLLMRAAMAAAAAATAMAWGKTMMRLPAHSRSSSVWDATTF
jgi:hypothetical protein